MRKGTGYHLTEKVGDAAVGNICEQSIEKECPRHWIRQGLLQLVHLEVLVSDSLLVDTDPRNGEDPIFFLEPTRIQLVVRDQIIEIYPEGNGQQTGNEEDNLPGLDRGAVFPRPNCDTVRNKSSEDLTPTVETEPNADATSLLSLRVPLRRSRLAQK